MEPGISMTVGGPTEPALEGEGTGPPPVRANIELGLPTETVPTGTRPGPEAERSSARGLKGRRIAQTEPSNTFDAITDPDAAANSAVRPSAPTLRESGVPANGGIVVRTSSPALAADPPSPPGPLPSTTSEPTQSLPSAGVSADRKSPSDWRAGDASLPPVLPVVSTSPSGRELVGVTLGRYEVLEELGHGGMATVYRARDPRLGRDVALKVIHRHLRENPEIAQRFAHEAQAVAKLKHPSIVEIYDVPDAPEHGERFLVAELVDGPSLRKFLQQTVIASGAPTLHTGTVPGQMVPLPPMPPEVGAALVLQILGALGRAHQEGIVHRDVKPENILLAGLGRGSSTKPSEPARPLPAREVNSRERVPAMAKLTDFGIAKILDAKGMTSTGQILGSPAHMAPEQIEGGEVTPRVDLFATGVLLYELLTGTLPFDGKNPAQVIRRVLDGKFTPADRVVAAVGGRWSAILSKMLARDPAARPESADALATTLRDELLAMGIVDPERELAEYLHDPVNVSQHWGARVKPLLLKRALLARQVGDPLGSAADLNRALAYDPSDPKLASTVTALRDRARRLEALRRLAPVGLLAVLVTSASFAGTRWVKAHRRAALQLTPVHGPTASPSPTTTIAWVPPSPTTSSPPPALDAAVHAPSTSGHAAASPGLSGAALRVVHINLSPPGTYSLDGQGPFDPLTAPDHALVPGDHKIEATGNRNCCERYIEVVKIAPGDGPLNVSIRFRMNPAKVFVNNLPEGASATVTVTSKDGRVHISGPPPLVVPMVSTELPAMIVIEGTGFARTEGSYTLAPGDPLYVDLTSTPSHPAPPP